jgi:hypothetical protein
VVCTRRVLSAWFDEEELVDACLLCLSEVFAGLGTILRLLLCARPALSRRRSFVLFGLPTLRLLCLRTAALSSFLSFKEPRRLETRVPDWSSSNSSEVRFFARLCCEKALGGGEACPPERDKSRGGGICADLGAGSKGTSDSSKGGGSSG